MVGGEGQGIHILDQGPPRGAVQLACLHKGDAEDVRPALGVVDGVEDLGQGFIALALDADVRRTGIEEELRVGGGVRAAEDGGFFVIVARDLAELPGAAGIGCQGGDADHIRPVHAGLDLVQLADGVVEQAHIVAQLEQFRTQDADAEGRVDLVPGQLDLLLVLVREGGGRQLPDGLGFRVDEDDLHVQWACGLRGGAEGGRSRAW